MCFLVHEPAAGHAVQGLLVCHGSGYIKLMDSRNIHNGYITLKTRLYSYVIK